MVLIANMLYAGEMGSCKDLSNYKKVTDWYGKTMASPKGHGCGITRKETQHLLKSVGSRLQADIDWKDLQPSIKT